MAYYSNFIKFVFLRSLWISATNAQRARIGARRRFSFFAFTSSPNENKILMIKKLKVKAKRRFYSPGEGKMGETFTHIIQVFKWLKVKVKGEGKNSELGECAMWEHVSA